MNIIEFVNTIFKDTNLARNQSDLIKSQVSFMLNRFCSIEFPLQAALLSHKNINGARLTDYWINFLTTKYSSNKKPPAFFYTKTKSLKSEQQKIQKDDINLYCEHHNITNADIQFIIKIRGSEFVQNEINELKKEYGIK